MLFRLSGFLIHWTDYMRIAFIADGRYEHTRHWTSCFAKTDA
jgi:hypothetical protein